MKYILLIYTDEKAWTESAPETCFAESIELTYALHSNLGAAPLHPFAVEIRPVLDRPGLPQGKA